MSTRRLWFGVDEVFANKYFPAPNPIGKRIDLDNMAARRLRSSGYLPSYEEPDKYQQVLEAFLIHN